jgi:hypothetical protein
LRFLALFGFLVGEGAMVVYSAQPIKVEAAPSCPGAPEIKLRPCRLAAI